MNMRLNPDGAVRVEPHVHRHEAFASHTVRAQFAEAEGWRDLPEQGHHVDVLDLPLRVRVILRPEDDKLAEMVWTEDGPVASEVIKVVHDDGNEEVEHQEGTDDEEADEVDVGKVAPTALWFSSIVGSLIALHVGRADTREHDLLPSFTVADRNRMSRDQKNVWKLLFRWMS